MASRQISSSSHASSNHAPISLFVSLKFLSFIEVQLLKFNRAIFSSLGSHRLLCDLRFSCLSSCLINAVHRKVEEKDDAVDTVGLEIKLLRILRLGSNDKLIFVFCNL